ncbi:unnamed protein product, partial [Didymodactylos carnosus]
NGLHDILEQSRSCLDNDLDLQIDIFLDEQKHDEQEFLGQFDQNDALSVCQAIQLQLYSKTDETATFLTTLQLLYGALASSTSEKKHVVLKDLLSYIIRYPTQQPRQSLISDQIKTVDNSSQTDTIPDVSLSYPQTNTSHLEDEKVVAVILPQVSPLDDAVKPPPRAPRLRSPPPPPAPPMPEFLQTLPQAPYLPPNFNHTTNVPPPPPAPPMPESLQTLPQAPYLPPNFNRTTNVPPPPPAPPIPESLQTLPQTPYLPPNFNHTTNVPPPPPPPAAFGVSKTSKPLRPTSKLLDSVPKPVRKTRRLQWKKLPQSIINTSKFWKDINNEDVNIDYNVIEKHFGIDESEAKNNHNEKLKKVTDRQQTQILNYNRSININVFLKRFNIDLNNLVKFIYHYDPTSKIFDVECLRMLSKILPTQDEVSQVHDHSSDHWGLPERYIDLVGSIPNYEFRIQTQLLMEDFSELHNDYQQKIKQILNNMNYFSLNLSIKHFLTSLLAIGDYLNYGSYCGDAFGFRIEFLKQLRDIKTQRSTNTNLLDVLLDTLSKEVKNDNINLPFIDDMKVMFANVLSLQNLKNDYMAMKKKIENGMNELCTINDDQLNKQYNQFYQNALGKLTELDKLMSECEQNEKELMTQFGENDPTEFNYDICMEIFRILIENIDLEQKERQKRQSTLVKRDNHQNGLHNFIRKLSVDQSPETTNLMDVLMKDLRKNKFATAPLARRRTNRGDLTNLISRDVTG